MGSDTPLSSWKLVVSSTRTQSTPAVLCAARFLLAIRRGATMGMATKQIMATGMAARTMATGMAARTMATGMAARTTATGTAARTMATGTAARTMATGTAARTTGMGTMVTTGTGIRSIFFRPALLRSTWRTLADGYVHGCIFDLPGTST
mmetsp:Transcript_76891/g.205509  ORF Transcript_76891/g.205509 Transcript_76891/m.205509 type:complete len:150 (-) Transcript_76891:87-536(-)